MYSIADPVGLFGFEAGSAVTLETFMADLYPITIIATRYGGAYEGGEWAAFNLYPEEVPAGATDLDSECDAWWRFPTHAVGVGSTPKKALKALKALVKARDRSSR